MNPVIQAIDEGHVAKYAGEKYMDPQSCRKDRETWPCARIRLAREKLTKRALAARGAR